MHAGQLSVTMPMVRSLVDHQFPQWRHRALRTVASSGTVNAIFRIGDDLAARFPLQAGPVDEARQWLQGEAEAARQLYGRTRFPTPRPVAIGAPDSDYPMPWSVQTWLPGTPATIDDPAGSVAFGHDLADFIGAVRDLDPNGRTFSGKGRGGDLTTHDEWVEVCLARSVGLLDVDQLRRMWTQLRKLPRHPGPDRMTHGDLIPGNVLVADGRLAGVLDVGGLGPADPALDLVCAWHLLDDDPRSALRIDLGCSDLEWARGRAWAFEQAIGLVWYYQESNPEMSAIGRRTLHRLLASA
jgi:aminoglycoside phosphotransferase (APT) family kinase protein